MIASDVPPFVPYPNLCICTDGTEIAVAKRRALLDAGDPFFGYKRAIAPLVPAVRSAHSSQCSMMRS